MPPGVSCNDMLRNAWCTNMRRHQARIVRVQRQSHDVVTLYFCLQDGSVLPYAAGQYITVYFDATSTPEGKAYSLSSAPSEPLMSITVKKIGEYSGRLHGLAAGNTFTISDAYGHFNPMTTKPLVCIGAGVGIAPLWSVIKHEYQHDAQRVAQLFYSNKTVDDVAFLDELAEASDATSLRVRHHITRQQEVPALMSRGRINIEKCLQAAEEEAIYLVCGSVSFVRDIWKELMTHGIAAERISTETFFE